MKVQTTGTYMCEVFDTFAEDPAIIDVPTKKIIKIEFVNNSKIKIKHIDNMLNNNENFSSYVGLIFDYRANYDFYEYANFVHDDSGNVFNLFINVTKEIK